MKKIFYIFPLILSSMFLAGCSNNEEQAVVAKEPQAISVAVVDVERGDVPVYIHAVGNIKATESVQIVSRTGGELLEIFVSEGDNVKKGDPLFSLDKKPLEVALQAANAGLQSNTIQLKKAEDDLERVMELSKVGSVSTDQIEQVTTQVNLLQTAIKVDRANVENATLNLSYADIKAPISGRIGAINIDKGNLLSAGQPVLTSIDNIETVEVTFYVPERYLAALLQGKKDHETMPVKATTVDGIEAMGELTFIGNVSPSTSTVMLKAEFANSENMLWVGQFVDIAVTVDILEDVMIVPEKAVALGPEGPIVYTIKNNEATLEKVEIGFEEGGYTVISSGIKDRDTVVVDGHVKLFDGAKVTIINNK